MSPAPTRLCLPDFQEDILRRIARRGGIAQQRIIEWFREHPLAYLYTHLLYNPFSLLMQPFYPDKRHGMPELRGGYF